jgi:transcriptional regulator with XRE-family HTH domain
MRPQFSARLGHLPAKFHNEIRRYRLQRGLTQQALARQLGIRIATISSWERGLTCPAIPMVFRLARFLDSSVQALYPDFAFLPPEGFTTPAA